MPDFAPIAIFAYNRAAHLAATLRSIRHCQGFGESKVIVFGDGPKSDGDRNAVLETRRIAQEFLGWRADFHFSEGNRGLAESITSGVNEVVQRYGQVIVVEDDLEVAPNFITYMNAGLARYRDESTVYQISGHMFEAPEFSHRRSALFLPFITTWGWATWKRAWDRFDPLATGWESLLADNSLRKRFNLDGTYDYTSMLARQMAGFRDSWGIRWYWSVFRDMGLACFPPVSLIRNTGMDGSGTHGRGVVRRFRNEFLGDRDMAITFPSKVSVAEEDLRAVQRSIWRHNGGWVGSAADRIRRQLRRLHRGMLGE